MKIELTQEDTSIFYRSIDGTKDINRDIQTPMTMRVMAAKESIRCMSDLYWLWVNGLSMHDEIIERAAIDEQIKQDSIQRQLGRMLLRRHSLEVKERLDIATSTTEEG